MTELKAKAGRDWRRMNELRAANRAALSKQEADRG